MNRVIEGRCLCGSTRFTITGPVSGIVECHCSMCRKAAGGAFGAFFVARRADLQWTDNSALTHYQSSPGLVRSFCARCGTAVTGANRTDPDDTIILAANMLDNAVALSIIAVEFTGDSVHWRDNKKDAPHFQGAFPGWSDLNP